MGLFKRTLRGSARCGWQARLVTLDGSNISAARNYFANLLLRRSDFTHLLMIDSDMSATGDLVCRMLRSDKPFVAAAYSKRSMDLEAYAEAARNPELTSTDRVALALNYNVQLDPGDTLNVTRGMCRVQRIALGFAALRRDAFETLIASGMVQQRPDRILQSLGLEGPIYDFFGEITLDDGDRLSEDYSLCHRWRQILGSEIWAVIDEPVGHIGDMIYGAPYLNRLRQGVA